jgi:hypothetical protein
LFSGYINSGYGGRSGYYFSAASVVLGSLVMILIDLHRRNLRRRKRARQSKKEAAEMNVDNDVGHSVGAVANNDVFERKNSFTDQVSPL